MEILDYVNKDDDVLGRAPRKDFAKRGLIHRSVHIYIFSSKGELLFQRRSPNKKISPNKLAVTGGHVSSGESYGQAAQRELREELGIQVLLKKILKTHHEAPEDRAVITIFSGKFDGDVNDIDFSKKEMTEIMFKPLSRVKEELKKNPDKYSRAFITGFRAYCNL